MLKKRRARDRERGSKMGLPRIESSNGEGDRPFSSSAGVISRTPNTPPRKGGGTRQPHLALHT